MNVYQVITDRIIQSLHNGVVPWRKPWHTETPKNFISGKDYRGVNVLLLQAGPHQSPYWLTFNQARNLGGIVRKGERGTPVVFWKVTEEKDARGEIEKSFILRYYTVFNVAQCQGVNALPAAPRPTFNPIEECERIVSRFTDRPPIEHGGNVACYVPSLDQIHLPSRESFASSAEYYSTLFHELTHATGAAHRLARKGVVDPSFFASHSYSQEELVAECGAAFLCGQAGIVNSTIDNSAAYIASWANKLKADPKLIVNAAAQAAKAADLILGKTSKQSSEEPAAQAA